MLITTLVDSPDMLFRRNMKQQHPPPPIYSHPKNRLRPGYEVLGGPNETGVH